MRLTKYEKDAITSVIAIFDPQARVYLFGSRVDDTKRGGDIDLLIMSDSLSLGDRGKISWELCGRLGEQKIDILIAKDTADPFVALAYKTGELLS
ncbi:nucleotidyltransferase domain-containing protein [Trichlorobacter sp.]|uniref:nucleotidyltransferase domain-containing protein n=1 Tax=Trichlorobacter sp. TaxID=2911007 RepID=UPI002A35933A|nr:nucleotidyltransferase domain-containing protein [Trichlorobacter sp.]MDY0384740.1 nucleotidyltransferase domain-containing protein [Trichlorobacter sp.]